MRLDKFLKVSRLIKRRTVAAEACDAGRVSVNGQAAKAGKRPRPATRAGFPSTGRRQRPGKKSKSATRLPFLSGTRP